MSTILTDTDFEGNGLLNMGQQTVAANSIISPTALTGNTDNYNPTDFQSASTLRISSTSAIDLTGIIAPDTDRSKKIVLVNIGTFPITLRSATTSAAANQFLLGDDIILSAERSYMLYYDQISDKWRDYGTGLTSLEGDTIKTVNGESMAGPGDVDTLLTLNADAPTQESANLVSNELQLVQATPTTDGVMSAEDKAKLDSISGASLAMKSGSITGASFTGSPKRTSVVTFATAFADANYSVSVIGNTEDTRNWSIESITAGSFTINSGSGSTLGGNVLWTAIKHGES